jgi:hypothetical protein
MIAYDRILDAFENIRTPRIKAIGKLNEVSFTRNRKMPFEDLTRFILAKKGKTTTMELNNYFKEIEKRENTVSKQAFSKQRLNLNPEVFIELNKDYVRRIYEQAEIKKYKGYLVTAIDGSAIEIPNTKKLQEEYDCESTGQSIHRTIARAVASGIYDVENNIMIDTILGKRTDGERALAKHNLNSMLGILGDETNIIVIFDRGYISIDLLLTLMETKIKYLFRLPSTTFGKEQRSLKTDDEIVDIILTSSRIYGLNDPIKREQAKKLQKLRVRIVKIKLSTGEIEYLLTNIENSTMSPKEIGELYYKRWGIELAYDVIKNKLNIENISGKSCLIIEQDFYAQMLLFNMVEDLRNDSNKVVEENKKKNLKYEYKVNMNILVGTFREYMIKIAIEEDDDKRRKMYTYMLDEIVSNLVPIRPKRSNPRKPYTGINKHKLNAKRNS